MSDTPPTYNTIVLGPLPEVHRAAGPYVNETLNNPNFPSVHYILWRYNPVAENRPEFCLQTNLPNASGYYKIYRIPEIWTLAETDLAHVVSHPTFFLPEVPYLGFVPHTGYLLQYDALQFGAPRGNLTTREKAGRDSALVRREISPGFDKLNDYQKQLWSIIQRSGLRNHFFDPFSSSDARQVFARWLNAVNNNDGSPDYDVIRTNAIRIYLITLAWCVHARVIAHVISTELDTRLRSAAVQIWSPNDRRHRGALNEMFASRFIAINPMILVNEAIGVVFSGATADDSVLKIIRSKLVCFDLVLRPHADPTLAGDLYGHIFVSPNCANVSRDSLDNTSLYRLFPLNVTAYKVEWWSGSKLGQSDLIRDNNRVRRRGDRDSDQEDHQRRYSSSDNDEIVMTSRPLGLRARQRTQFIPLPDSGRVRLPPSSRPRRNIIPPTTWSTNVSPSWLPPVNDNPPSNEPPRRIGGGWDEIIEQDRITGPTGWGTPTLDPWTGLPIPSEEGGAAASTVNPTTNPESSTSAPGPLPPSPSTATAPVPTAAPSTSDTIPPPPPIPTTPPIIDTTTTYADRPNQQPNLNPRRNEYNRGPRNSYQRGETRGRPYYRNTRGRGRGIDLNPPVRYNYNTGFDETPSRAYGYDSYRPRYNTPTPPRTPSPPPAYVPAGRVPGDRFLNSGARSGQQRDTERPSSPIRTEAAPPPRTRATDHNSRGSPTRNRNRSRTPSPRRSNRTPSRERYSNRRRYSRDRENDRRSQRRDARSRSRSRTRQRQHSPDNYRSHRRRSSDTSRSRSRSRPRSRSHSRPINQRTAREGTPYSEASQRSNRRRRDSRSRSRTTSHRPTPNPKVIGTLPDNLTLVPTRLALETHQPHVRAKDITENARQHLELLLFPRKMTSPSQMSAFASTWNRYWTVSSTKESAKGDWIALIKKWFGKM